MSTTNLASHFLLALAVDATSTGLLTTKRHARVASKAKPADLVIKEIRNPSMNQELPGSKGHPLGLDLPIG
ncbi:hypothetical protein LZ30DRAFT_737614, partial [Colletotrichum cereale]